MFLQKTLPLLRAQSRLPQSTTPQKILPQQPIQQKPATPTHTAPQPGQKPGAQVQKIQIVPQPGQQMLKQVILTPAQQQQILRRQHQLNAQRVLLTTSTGAVSASQAVSTSRNVVMVHAPPGSVGTKMVVTPVKTQAGTTAASAAAADKLKPKGFTGISRYNIEFPLPHLILMTCNRGRRTPLCFNPCIVIVRVFQLKFFCYSSGDDDINDVTSMAGVNLMVSSPSGFYC